MMKQLIWSRRLEALKVDKTISARSLIQLQSFEYQRPYLGRLDNMAAPWPSRSLATRRTTKYSADTSSMMPCTLRSIMRFFRNFFFFFYLQIWARQYSKQ